MKKMCYNCKEVLAERRMLVFFCDYHTHTKYSFDGDAIASVYAMCESAILRGITDIAFTDHFEANSLAEGLYSPYDAESAKNDIMAAKEKYKDRLYVTYGIEIGQANQYPLCAEEFLQIYQPEFVIGSLHNLSAEPDFYYMDFTSMSDEQINCKYGLYLDEVSQMLDSITKIDTVGHITYPQRYAAGANKSIDFSLFCEKFEAILKKMISKDVALEMNSSTYFKGLGFSMPDKEILSLYKSCGGKLITLGSDAHSPACVGGGTEYSASLLREFGFDSVVVVRNSQKELIKID